MASLPKWTTHARFVLVRIFLRTSLSCFEMNPARWTLRCEWCSSEWFCVWRGTLGTKPLVRYPACKRRVRYAWCKTPCSTKPCIYRCSLKLPVELNGLTTMGAAVWMAVCVVKAAQADAWITELTFKGNIWFKTFFNNFPQNRLILVLWCLRKRCWK